MAFGTSVLALNLKLSKPSFFSPFSPVSPSKESFSPPTYDSPVSSAASPLVCKYSTCLSPSMSPLPDNPLTGLNRKPQSETICFPTISSIYSPTSHGQALSNKCISKLKPFPVTTFPSFPYSRPSSLPISSHLLSRETSSATSSPLSQTFTSHFKSSESPFVIGPKVSRLTSMKRSLSANSFVSSIKTELNLPTSQACEAKTCNAHTSFISSNDSANYFKRPTSLPLRSNLPSLDSSPVKSGSSPSSRSYHPTALLTLSPSSPKGSPSLSIFSRSSSSSSSTTTARRKIYNISSLYNNVISPIENEILRFSSSLPVCPCDEIANWEAVHEINHDTADPALFSILDFPAFNKQEFPKCNEEHLLSPAYSNFISHNNTFHYVSALMSCDTRVVSASDYVLKCKLFNSLQSDIGLSSSIRMRTTPSIIEPRIKDFIMNDFKVAHNSESSGQFRVFSNGTIVKPSLDPNILKNNSRFQPDVHLNRNDCEVIVTTPSVKFDEAGVVKFVKVRQCKH